MGARASGSHDVHLLMGGIPERALDKVEWCKKARRLAEFLRLDLPLHRRLRWCIGTTHGLLLVCLYRFVRFYCLLLTNVHPPTIVIQVKYLIEKTFLD